MALKQQYPVTEHEAHEVLTLMSAGFSYSDVMAMQASHRPQWLSMIKARERGAEPPTVAHIAEPQDAEAALRDVLREAKEQE